MWLQKSDNDTICNGLMNVSLTSTFIPPLQIHFSDNANLFKTVPFTKSFLHDDFYIYIQYVFCYPLTENINYKQLGLYILKL